VLTIPSGGLQHGSTVFVEYQDDYKDNNSIPDTEDANFIADVRLYMLTLPSGSFAAFVHD